MTRDVYLDIQIPHSVNSVIYQVYKHSVTAEKRIESNVPPCPTTEGAFTLSDHHKAGMLNDDITNDILA